MVARSSVKLVTSEELAAMPDRDRYELIHGSIVERVMPSFGHALGGPKLGELLGPFNRKPGSPRGPGGWWILSEIHVEYDGHETFCHDVAGWRRENMSVPPEVKWPMRLRPDWVCEIASPNHEKRDFVDKPAVLHRARVPHYWILHPEQRMLIVQRWSEAGYTTILSAGADQRVKAEPFDTIEIYVGELFGEESDE